MKELLPKVVSNHQPITHRRRHVVVVVVVVFAACLGKRRERVAVKRTFDFSFPCVYIPIPPAYWVGRPPGEIK